MKFLKLKNETNKWLTKKTFTVFCIFVSTFRFFFMCFNFYCGLYNCHKLIFSDSGFLVISVFFVFFKFLLYCLVFILVLFLLTVMFSPFSSSRIYCSRHLNYLRLLLLCVWLLYFFLLLHFFILMLLYGFPH